jgi:hypothetical protein
MRSHEAHEHEHDEHEHERDDIARAAPLHHPRRTAGSPPNAKPIQKREGSPFASFGAAVNAGIHVQARGDLNGPDVHQMAAYGVSSGGSSLPHAAAIQASFGHHDISGVRAHVGGKAEEASNAIGAHAYATGDSVAFASTPDLHLAAHEAAHVVQQRGGVRLSDGVGRSGDEYERHADAVADLVVQGKSAQSLLDQYAHRGATGGAAVQKQDHGHGGGHASTPEHAPTEAEMCAGPTDSVNPSLAYEAMLSTAEARGREIGTGAPHELLNEVLASIQQIIEQGRSGTTGVLTETLSGTWTNHDWRVRASVERRAVADCGSARGSGTAGRTGSTTSSTHGREASSTDTTTVEGSGSRGTEAGPTGGGTSSATVRGSESSARTRTRRSAGGVEGHGPETRATTVRTETDGRVYEYIVTWTVETEISRTPEWHDLFTLYAGTFRDAFEPTPWTHDGTTSVGTRREDDTHAATSRARGRSGPRRPTRIE